MEATSRHDHCCLLGRKASIQTKNILICLYIPDTRVSTSMPGERTPQEKQQTR